MPTEREQAEKIIHDGLRNAGEDELTAIDILRALVARSPDVLVGGRLVCPFCGQNHNAGCSFYAAVQFVAALNEEAARLESEGAEVVWAENQARLNRQSRAALRRTLGPINA